MKKKILCAVMVGMLSQQGLADTTIYLGSVGTDHLGGIGSSKSILGVELSSKYAAVRAWHIAEGLDDDLNISPSQVYTLEAYNKYIGLHYSNIKTDAFEYVAVGYKNDTLGVFSLIPVNNDRFGFKAYLKSSISAQWSAKMYYEYIGRQDPDIKITIVGIGVNHSF